MKANPEMIKMWSLRDKCWMCKHKFDKSVILPVDHPVRGKFHPNYNQDILFHMFDTHGLPYDVVTDWIFASIYGLELTEMGHR